MGGSRHVLAWVVVLIAAGHSAVHAQQTAAIAGVLREPGGGLLRHVEVTLLQRNQPVAVQRSDRNGTVVFTGLGPGQYGVSAALTGFEPAIAYLNVGAGATEHVALVLELTRRKADHKTGRSRGTSETAQRAVAESPFPPPSEMDVAAWLALFSGEINHSSGPELTVDGALLPAAWNSARRVAVIALRTPAAAHRGAPRHLTVLVDASATAGTRLPLTTEALRTIPAALGANDRVAIVAYGRAGGLVLPSTAGHDRTSIVRAIDSVGNSSSSPPEGDLPLAVRVARQRYLASRLNRLVIFAGADARLGALSAAEQVRLLESARESGVDVSIIGIGADHGDGPLREFARKVGADYALAGTGAAVATALLSAIDREPTMIAEDVTLDVAFDGWSPIDSEPAAAGALTLRAGETLIRAYELEPAPVRAAGSTDAAVATVRYRVANSDVRRATTVTIGDATGVTSGLGFATAVAQLAMLLRQPHLVSAGTLAVIRRLAETDAAPDRFGHRAAFIALVKAAEERCAAEPIGLTRNPPVSLDVSGGAREYVGR